VTEIEYRLVRLVDRMQGEAAGACYNLEGAMRDYEQRLERVEKALGAQEPEVLMVCPRRLRQIPPVPIAGWRSNDRFDCPRAPFESEEHLAEHAKS